MATVDPRPLTRKELASFLPSQRAIRAFEKLFDLVPSDLNTLEADIEEANILAGSGQAMAAQALAELQRQNDLLELIATKPDYSKESQNALELSMTPAVCHGTISFQNSDAIEISGGQISAVITDSSTDLIKSSQALGDGTAANAGTLTNAPAAGDPTKWVPIDDNGTTRYIPAW